MCVLIFYICLFFAVKKYNCLPLWPINSQEFDHPDYIDIEKDTREPLYYLDLTTTTTTEKPKLKARILAKLREDFIKRPDLATGALYPKGFYVGFPDLTGVVTKVAFYCNVNQPLHERYPLISHHHGVVTEKDVTGYFMYEQREREVEIGDIVYCKLDITTLNGEEYLMRRRFGILRYKTTTDSEYVGGLIG